MPADVREALAREARAARNRATMSDWSPIKGTAATGPTEQAVTSVAALRVEREQELTARATGRPRS